MTTREIITKEFKLRTIDEGLQRIYKCVDYLSEDELWLRPTETTNSVGNLIIHLEGNVRQYILCAIAGQKDLRTRSDEFDHSYRRNRADILEALSQTLEKANMVVKGLEEKEYQRKESVQGFEMTVLSCIIHVIEHFSYHVGQITFYTKLTKNIDTAYYSGKDLDKNRD